MRFSRLPIRASAALCAPVVLAALSALAIPAGALGGPTPKPSHQPVTTLGTLVQLSGSSGCLVERSAPRAGCQSVRALRGPAPFLGSEAIAIGPEGRNVYVASSTSNAIAVFRRNARTGHLTQSPGVAGCITAQGAGGCATGIGLEGPNSVAISPDGRNVYATSLNSNAIDIFARNPSTGALTQASGDAGCIVQAPLTGCTTGVQLGGADAVAVSSDDHDVYVTSVLSNSVTSFTRSPTSGQLTQQTGTSACVLYVLAVGCSLGQALSAPEGLAVSPDGASVYATAFASGAIDVLDRSAATGALTQKPRRAGCLAVSVPQSCELGRGLLGVSSIAVSPDGRFVYSAAFASNALSIFKRVTKTVSRARGAGRAGIQGSRHGHRHPRSKRGQIG